MQGPRHRAEYKRQVQEKKIMLEVAQLTIRVGIEATKDIVR